MRLSKFTHNWKIAKNQSDTGTHGVRLICSGSHAETHELVVHRDLLKNYVKEVDHA